jgi:hypothetical protein
LARADGVNAPMEAVEEYLHLRRALGYKLVRQGQLLQDFACYLDIHGADHVTVDLAVAWSTLPRKVQPTGGTSA